MEYIKLGNTGMDVSKIALGCMSFGTTGTGLFPWAMGEEKARPMIQRALELGINYFDTANIYQNGTSEEITGKILNELADRDEIVVATKVDMQMRPGPNGGGLSRKAIMGEIDKSLQRLGMDYVDLYQIHRLDPNTSMEEIMEALHDVVKSGKVRYIGASSMYAWQFLKLQNIAEKHNWTKFVTMQNHYNLMYREEEREMIPLCQEEKIGIIPWSPLAAGRLTHEWEAVTERTKIDDIAKMVYDSTKELDKIVVERLKEVAANRGISMAQMALAWLLQKDYVNAPIVGTRSVQHIEEAVGALSIKLTSEEVNALEALYVPHPVLGMM